MKFCFAVLLFCLASAEESIRAAQYGSPFGYNFHQQPMYNSFNLMPQKTPEQYLSMKDEDFPVDYSLSCSNTCGCRQACAVMWWMPCTCRCPPPCGCWGGCIWGCCGNKCCEETTTTKTTTPTTTTTTLTTTTVRDDETTKPDDCQGGCCKCSCQPCVIVWMCPPQCGPGCCGGGSSCCNGTNNSCCGK